MRRQHGLQAAQTQDQLRELLEEKATALASVQRNYDTISRMMQLKQQELEQVRTQYDTESQRCVSLSVQLEDMRARVTRAEALAAKVGPLQDQLAALQASLSKLQYEASLASGRAATNIDKLVSAQKAAEDAEFKAQSLVRERDAWASSESSLKAELQRLHSELDACSQSMVAASKDAKSARVELESTREVAAARESKVVALQAALAAKDDRIAGMDDQLRSLQSSLQEAQTLQRQTEVALATAKGQHAVAEGQLRSMNRTLALAQEATAISERKSSHLAANLETVKSALMASEAKVAQLNNLVDDAEERYQTCLLQGLETSDSLTRLQVQLTSYKALASDAQRQLSEAFSAHSADIEAARAASLESEAKAASMVARMTQMRRMQADFISTLLPRVDKALGSLASLQAGSSAGLSQLADSTERMLGALGQRLSMWEQSAVEKEEALGSMTRALRALSANMLARSTVSIAEANSNSELRKKVAALEGLLAAEQASKQQLSQAKARGEAQAAEQLAAVRAAAEERIAGERSRLTSRLAALEAEVQRLQVACDADRAASAQMLAMERQELQRQVDRAKAEMQEAKDAADKVRAEVLAAGKDSLAALNRSHAAEVEHMMRSHVEEVMSLEASLETARANIKSAWEAARRLLADMGVVGGHLAKMGWPIQQADTGVVQALGSEDGSGAVLSKGATLLRLHFSYITEAVQDAARKPAPKPESVSKPAPAAPLPAAPAKDWSGVARELRATVAKLIHVEEALATSCTCMLCLEGLKQPTTCIPCGHTYCKKCLDKHKGLCAECGDAVVMGTISNAPLEAICSKYEFKLSALQSIQKAVAQ